MQKPQPKLIGKGGYGCVYSPPTCSLEDIDETQGYVGKVSNEQKVKIELLAARVIKESIPDWGRYFGLLTGRKCPVEATSQLQEDCPLVRKLQPPLYSYFSPYLGVALRNYRQPFTIDWLWTSLSQLLKGLRLLHQTGVYHMDITNKNIVVDERGVCRLIDFGIAHVNPTIKDVLERKDQGFYEANPAFYNAFMTREGFGLGRKFNPLPETVERYYDEYENLLQFFYPNYEKNTASDFIKTLLYSASLNKYVENIVWPNLAKVDLYQLAETFNNFGTEYVQTLDTKQERLMEPYTQLINGLIHVDVNQQWNIDKALAHIEKTNASRSNKQIL